MQKVIFKALLFCGALMLLSGCIKPSGSLSVINTIMAQVPHCKSVRLSSVSISDGDTYAAEDSSGMRYIYELTPHGYLNRQKVIPAAGTKD